MVESREWGVLDTLVGIGRKHGKGYCYPSQKTILELMERFHNVRFCRRTLNRDLGDLERQGYITRLRRHRRGTDGKIRFASTLYRFTAKLFNYLMLKGKGIKKVFDIFRVPKLAQHPRATAKHLPSDARLSCNLVTSEVLKEVASAPLSGERHLPGPWEKLLASIEAL